MRMVYPGKVEIPGVGWIGAPVTTSLMGLTVKNFKWRAIYYKEYCG